MEALALRIIGGFQNLLGEVSFTRFNSAGHAAGPLDRDDPPKAMRLLADDSRVRWPHDAWAKAYTRAKFARDMLAHMLFIESVTGEQPNRIMTVTMLGEPGAPRRTKGGNPGELSWRDDTWSMQKRWRAPFKEEALIEALADLKWLIDCCRGLGRIRDLLSNEDAYLPDDKPIDAYMWQVNWWLPEWGDQQTTQLTVGHIRLCHGEKNLVDGRSAT
jgi:hypothetical protein